MAATYGTLAGLPLDAHQKLEWPMKVGVEPTISSFLVDIDVGKKIFEAATGTPLESHNFTLELGGLDKVVTINRLLILGRAPGNSPHNTRVVVADRRYLLRRSVSHRAYNVRMRGSNTKRLQGEDVPIQIADIEFDIMYARASLKPDGFPWTAGEVLASVLEELAKGAPGALARYFEFSVPKAFKNEQEIQDLELDDNGATALARVLQFVPVAECWCNYDGVLEFYDRFSGHEADVLNATKGEIVGAGHVEHIDNVITRPREVHVLFTREHEVRFDFIDDPQATVVLDKETRYLQNVLPIPDPTLIVDGEDQAYVQGSFITVEQALAAWDSGENTPGPLSIAYNKRVVRENWGLDLRTNLWGNILDKLEATNALNLGWVARHEAIRTHFRQTFRVNHHWVSKVRKFVLERSSILNTETGSRAPASVYAGYALMVTHKGNHLKDLASFVANIPSFVNDNMVLAESRPSAATLSALISEQGIFRFNFWTDPYGIYGRLFPSLTEGSIIADPKYQRDLDEDGNPYLFTRDQIKKSNTFKLAEEHRASIVISCIPWAPNSTRALHRVVVTPDQIGFTKGNGPPIEIRVPAGLETARFRWSDTNATLIEKAMGKDFEILTPEEQEKLRAELLVNELVVHNLAKAFAQAVYKTMADRAVGTRTIELTPDVPIGGHITGVTHTIDTSGGAYTTIDIAPEVRPVDFMAFVPHAIRRVILQLVTNDRL